MGPTDEIRDGLARRLHTLHEATGGPVSLVGMSLGGVLARSLTREHPELVRRVVTMGSPFRPYEIGASPLPVPSTAVYSRGDGIVDWCTCVDVDGRESVEVPGSHCGLGHNPPGWTTRPSPPTTTCAAPLSRPRAAGTSCAP